MDDQENQDWIKRNELELRRYRAKLATCLRTDDVPDGVWMSLIKEFRYLYYAITGGDEESWEELEAEARRLLEVWRSRSPSSGSVPSRVDRGAKEEVAVEIDEYTEKRSQVFSEVAAALAESFPGVKNFRKEFLGDLCPLSEEQAGELLYGEDSLEERRTALDALKALSQELSKAYRWRENAAKWFVLTGYTPYVQPLNVTVSRRQGSSYYPNTTRITLTVEPWVDAEQVEKVYRDVQRQVIGGDNKKKKERTLDAVRSVAQQMKEHGDEPWSVRTTRWNYRQIDPERRYKSRGGLQQAFERFVHPNYRSPRYKPYAPEPWQLQRHEHNRRYFEKYIKALPSPQ